MSHEEMKAFIRKAGHRPHNNELFDKITVDMIKATIKVTGKTKIDSNDYIFKAVIR
jgi:hypothetical protein